MVFVSLPMFKVLVQKIQQLGALRLIVESIDPTYTLGKIALEKQKLINLLKENGTLEKNKQVELPLVPLNIGLITAHDSAAYNDFLSELKLSGYSFKVFFRKALMQGKNAQGDVCQAIEDLSKIEKLDVIVITRGGGSIAELSCFDSKKIAEKIARSHLPVFSGIGHEINIPVTDLAAHTYQKTPTAIAQLLVTLIEEFMTVVDERAVSVLQGAQQKIDDERERLKGSVFNLQSQTINFLKLHTQDVIRFMEVIKVYPLKLLKESSLKVNNQRDLILRSIKASFKAARVKTDYYKRIAEIANPCNTLRRGFSITRTECGVLIKGTDNLKFNDTIITQLTFGKVKSQVQHIDKEEKGG